MPRKIRRRPPPSGVFSANVTGLAHDGRGIAHIDSKAVFIQDALPDEQVQFHYTATHS